MINYNIPNSISQFQPKAKLFDFSDLDFKSHANDKGVQARLDLGNGLEVSVVANNDEGEGLYGRVSESLYEVAIYDQNDHQIPLSAYSNVLGWQSPDQISYLMAKAQNEGSVWVDELEDAKAEYLKELGLDN